MDMMNKISEVVAFLVIPVCKPRNVWLLIFVFNNNYDLKFMRYTFKI